MTGVSVYLVHVFQPTSRANIQLESCANIDGAGRDTPHTADTPGRQTQKPDPGGKPAHSDPATWFLPGRKRPRRAEVGLANDDKEVTR